MPYKDPEQSRLCQARYRERNRVAIRARRALYADKIEAGRRRYYAENKEKFRDYSRQRRYGLTPEAFNELLDSQGGKCAVCGTNEYVGPGKCPHIDHDHKTGKIRGLVCVRCNVLLGMAQDQHERFIAAIRYLEKHAQLTKDELLA